MMHYPTPWRTELHRDAAWKAHIVDACGHNVILSVERSLADLIVEAVNARHHPSDKGTTTP